MPMTQRKGPEATGTLSETHDSTTRIHQCNRDTDNSRELAAGLRRRGEARSYLSIGECPTCGEGVVDPWPHRCENDSSLAAVDAWAHTVDALLAAGLTPMLPAPVARALWRRGGSDRDLAALVADRGGVIA